MSTSERSNNYDAHSALDRYVHSSTLCNSLALLVSQCSLIEYARRIGLLVRLQQCWTEGHDSVLLVCPSSSHLHNAASHHNSDISDNVSETAQHLSTEDAGAETMGADVEQLLPLNQTSEADVNKQIQMLLAECNHHVLAKSCKQDCAIPFEEDEEVLTNRLSVAMHKTIPKADNNGESRKTIKWRRGSGESRDDRYSLRVGSSKPTLKTCSRWSSTIDSSNRLNAVKTTNQQVVRSTYCSSVGAGRVCPICGRQFKKPSWLQSHLVTHTGERPYACRHPGCDKRFGQSSTRNFHESVHSETRPFVCVQCGFAFKSATSLRLHVRNLHASAEAIAKRRRHECAACGRLFKMPGQMRKHARQVHGGERPHGCDSCSKRFKSRTQLERHRLALHSEERPWHCPVCGKGFAQSGNMKTHMRTHTGEKPYVCTECGCRFAHSGTLKGHMATHRSAASGDETIPVASVI